MNYVNEEKLVEYGFIKLHDGKTFVLIDMYKDEVKDIVVAKRVLSVKGMPLAGFMFVGFEIAEYHDDWDKARLLLSL